MVQYIRSLYVLLCSEMRLREVRNECEMKKNIKLISQCTDNCYYSLTFIVFNFIIVILAQYFYYSI